MRNCSGCHGLDGSGLAPSGAALPNAPRNLTDAEFHAQRTDEQLLFSIKNGKGNMPPFGILLSDEQLHDVLAYVRTLPLKGKR